MATLVILLVCAVCASGFADPVSVSVNITDRSMADINLTEEDLKSLPSVTPHIVGGTPVNQPIPFQVSLRAQVDGGNLNPDNLKHFCGASLITQSHLLTAAHCFNEKVLVWLRAARIYAVIGTNLVLFNPRTTVVTMVQSVIKHRSYNDNAHPFDVAVLKLYQPAMISRTISPIAMRTRNTNVGEKCQISGWGVRKFNTSIIPNTLQITTISVVNQNTCKSIYNGLGLGPITDDMMCAGEPQGGKDTCQGDSGGPFVCGGELTGVVSWGYKCAQRGVPGVYASVAYFTQWIQDAMRQLDNLPTSPTSAPTNKPSSAGRSTIDILAVGVVLTTVLTTRLL